jgi:hypothetical protein
MALFAIPGVPTMRVEVLWPQEEPMRTWFLEPGWERFLQDCDPDVVTWPVEAPLASVLHRSPGWRSSSRLRWRSFFVARGM